jgi:hypothetical protein
MGSPPLLPYESEIRPRSRVDRDGSTTAGGITVSRPAKSSRRCDALQDLRENGALHQALFWRWGFEPLMATPSCGTLDTDLKAFERRGHCQIDYPVRILPPHSPAENGSSFF